MSVTVGDPVCVLSRSSGTWYRDGVIVKILVEATTVEGEQPMPAGAVKVIYDGTKSAKWVPPEAFGEEIREADFQIGDGVSVFVRSKGLWSSDGFVEQVLEEAATVDEVSMPAGAIRVIYQNKEYAKWIPPELFGDEVKVLRSYVPENVDELVYSVPSALGAEKPAAAAADEDDAYIVSKVAGAGRAVGGRYVRAGVHNERPKYKSGSGGIIFFDFWWKMNVKDDVLQWCYEVKTATGEEMPCGTWNCTRFYNKSGSHPPVEVKKDAAVLKAMAIGR
mmetsp:Transcript_59194/g.150335  ORF Transcript_59194/g.150335 Transcript_59194/m.150335 type:complete len:277 (+) Transcript_59194:64-894(+)